MEFQELDLKGVLKFTGFFAEDSRGHFFKNFSSSWPQKSIHNFHPQESFFSFSHHNVIRGLHFQIPPHDHQKIVCPLTGKILDVVLDLRKSSETYGQAIGIELDSSKGEGIYIPSGFAHGFLTLDPNGALVSYLQTSPHSPSHDQGILWSSINFNWSVINPILSERDQSFPELKNVGSLFP